VTQSVTQGITTRSVGTINTVNTVKAIKRRIAGKRVSAGPTPYFSSFALPS
jgi:hypothetical protein